MNIFVQVLFQKGAPVAFYATFSTNKDAQAPGTPIAKLRHEEQESLKLPCNGRRYNNVTSVSSTDVRSLIVSRGLTEEKFGEKA